MASTIPGSTSPCPHQSTPPRSTISLGRSSPSPSSRRQAALSFSEQSHPRNNSSSFLPSDASVHGANDNHSTNEASVGGQRNGEVQDRQPKAASITSSSTLSQEPKQPWYRRLASNYRSISLSNTGSVARDHLALERTFLAWLRTSLAFASIGIAITQLFRLNTSLAEQRRQQQQQQREDLEHLTGGNEGASLLPLSPLMGASLTPEIYEHIQTVLQRQEYPIRNPSDNAAFTLLDQLVLHPTQLDSHSTARLRHLGKPLGATFLGISIIILFIGFHRYFESQHWIIRGQFPASRGSVALTGLVAVALMVASLVVVLVISPTPSH